MLCFRVPYYARYDLYSSASGSYCNQSVVTAAAAVQQGVCVTSSRCISAGAGGGLLLLLSQQQGIENRTPPPPPEATILLAFWKLFPFQEVFSVYYVAKAGPQYVVSPRRKMRLDLLTLNASRSPFRLADRKLL